MVINCQLGVRLTLSSLASNLCSLARYLPIVYVVCPFLFLLFIEECLLFLPIKFWLNDVLRHLEGGRPVHYGGHLRLDGSLEERCWLKIYVIFVVVCSCLRPWLSDVLEVLFSLFNKSIVVKITLNAICSGDPLLHLFISSRPVLFHSCFLL